MAHGYFPNNNNWTDSEIEYLRTWYGRKPVQSIADELGRTRYAVFGRARKDSLVTPETEWAIRKVNLEASYWSRFWSRVLIDDSDKCWEWGGAFTTKGYGKFKYKGQSITASRIMYQLWNGVELGRYEFVCHSCDNPPCCNPAHLWLGTPKDNTDDKVSKDRHVKGELCHRARLTEDEVREIKRLRGKESIRSLSKRFNVHKSAISHIFGGRSWKHVTASNDMGLED